MESQKSDRRHRAYIEAIRVRAKGLAVSKARGIADGLGQAIAEALTARGLTRAGVATVRMMQLGRIAADGRSSATLRTEIAAMVATSVARLPDANG